MTLEDTDSLLHQVAEGDLRAKGVLLDRHRARLLRMIMPFIGKPTFPTGTTRRVGEIQFLCLSRDALGFAQIEVS
jgi:hypothetical protein